VKVLILHDFDGTARQDEFQNGGQFAHFIVEGSSVASEGTPEAVK
jgi:hypothetical protein